MSACDHCGGDIEIRNPKGFCDHLYYPDSCEFCKSKKPSTTNREFALQNEVRLKVEEIGRLLTENSRLRESLQDIHDVAFDGDNCKTANELGIDIASMAKKALER